jgi:hypothetical protein
MNELSPAAQAVLDAALPHMVHRYSVAAALRAAVAQTQRHPGHDIWQCDADDLLAIAAELEANP